MRVGQALELRHADFLPQTGDPYRRPPDNANGARAKLRTAATIPVSTPLVRLYSDYMHEEYGELDFTAHMLRHTDATDGIRQGVPIEIVARLLTHRSSTTASQTYVS